MKTTFTAFTFLPVLIFLALSFLVLFLFFRLLISQSLVISLLSSPFFRQLFTRLFTTFFFFSVVTLWHKSSHSSWILLFRCLIKLHLWLVLILFHRYSSTCWISCSCLYLDNLSLETQSSFLKFFSQSKLLFLLIPSPLFTFSRNLDSACTEHFIPLFSLSQPCIKCCKLCVMF